MPVETRYTYPTQHTINGLTAMKLLNVSASANTIFDAGRILRHSTSYIGVKIYKRSSGGSETLILDDGAGNPYQINSWTTGAGFSDKTAIISIPKTSLVASDSIVVKYYGKVGSTGSWVLMLAGAFQSVTTTEQLGATEYGGNDQTFHVYAKSEWFAGLGQTYVFLMMGYQVGVDYTYIVNFSFSEATEQVYSVSNVVSAGLTLTDSANANGSGTGDWANAKEKWYIENWEFTIGNHTVVGTLDFVQLQIKHYQSGYSNDTFKLQVYDGSAWHDVETWNTGNLPPPSDETDFHDVSSILDSWVKVDACKVRITSTAKTGAEDKVTWYVDRVKLKIAYVPPPPVGGILAQII